MGANRPPNDTVMQCVDRAVAVTGLLLKIIGSIDSQFVNTKTAIIRRVLRKFEDFSATEPMCIYLCLEKTGVGFIGLDNFFVMPITWSRSPCGVMSVRVT